MAAGSWGVGSTASRGGSSVVGSGSWFAIFTSEWASGVSVGIGLGTGAEVGVGAGAGVAGGSSALDNYGIAVTTSAGAGLA